MRPLASPTEALVRPLRRLAVNEGVNPTVLPEIVIVRVDRPSPRTPVVYTASLCVVAQGVKRTYFGDRSVIYDPQHYLVVSNQLPLEAEILEASPDAPLLGLILEIDVSVVSQLLLEMTDRETASIPDGRTRPALITSQMDEQLLESLCRLVRSLEEPLDGRILGRALIREVLYRVLCGEQGDHLRALAGSSSGNLRVARVIRYLEQNYASRLDISTMARVGAMSESSLHHTFKEVTSLSPLQYLKRLRLHQARLLMQNRGLSAGEASYQVGYESASQFSREFKRMFGISPSQTTDYLPLPATG